jgi:uncharacterized protein YkwD
MIMLHNAKHYLKFMLAILLVVTLSSISCITIIRDSSEGIDNPDSGDIITEDASGLDPLSDDTTSISTASSGAETQDPPKEEAVLTPDQSAIVPEQPQLPPQSPLSLPDQLPVPIPIPVSAPPVINFFSANPSYIEAGGSTVLSWNVSGASSVFLDHGGGYVNRAGTAAARLYWTTTFVITASNMAGSVTQAVTVRVAAPPQSLPVINYFAASPTYINSGNSSTLSWNVSGASSIYLDRGGGYVSSSGSATARPSSTATYTLTASNNAGTVNRSITVTVASAPLPPPALPSITSFTASPSSISSGGSSTLSWSTLNATSVYLDHGGGNVSGSSTATARPSSTTVYKLTASNAAGSVYRTVTVTVASAPAPVPAPTPKPTPTPTPTTPTPTPKPTPPPPTPPAVNAASCEQALFNAVNAVRASNGKSALARNSYIDSLCRQQAQYMMAKATLSHDNVQTRYDGIYKNVAGTKTVAENVLQANSPCDANYMAQMWFNSPGHKTNMLNSAYTKAGMGIVVGSDGRIWACQLFAGP